MKKLLLLAAALVTVTTAHATLYTTNFNWSVNQAVPDNNYSGWVNSQTISGQAGTIDPGSLLVSLDLTGGWNGDLYAYLIYNNVSVVLLDRVGPGTYGYGTAGMNVWLTDATGPSIDTTEFPTSGGTYSRSDYAGSLAASYDGLNPNGQWSLFIADLNAGGVTTVQSWGLQMDIVAVPEIESWIAAALAGAFGAFWLNRQVFGRMKG